MITAIASAALKIKEVSEVLKRGLENGEKLNLTPKFLEGVENTAVKGSIDNPFRLPRCINRRLDGNGLFENKIFEMHGVSIEGVFPKFDGPMVKLNNYYLSDDFWKDNNNNDAKCYREQMKEASRQLYKQIKADPSYAKILNLNEDQINALRDGKQKIPGKVWHHFEELGEKGEPIMQLVNESIHNANKHTGGSYTWNEKHLEKKYGEEVDLAKQYNSV